MFLFRKKKRMKERKKYVSYHCNFHVSKVTRTVSDQFEKVKKGNSTVL
jgi:hypothetical protein